MQSNHTRVIVLWVFIVAAAVHVTHAMLDIIVRAVISISVRVTLLQHGQECRLVKGVLVIPLIQINGILVALHVIPVRLLLKMGYVLPARLVNMQILNTQNVSLVMMEQLAMVFVCLRR